MQRSSSQETTPVWRRSTFCSAGTCIEVASRTDGSVVIRDSKNAAQPPLVFTRDEMRAWIAGVKAGEFDDFC
jgi:hypothetical protein